MATIMFNKNILCVIICSFGLLSCNSGWSFLAAKASGPAFSSAQSPFLVNALPRSVAGFLLVLTLFLFRFLLLQFAFTQILLILEAQFELLQWASQASDQKESKQTWADELPRRVSTLYFPMAVGLWHFPRS